MPHTPATSTEASSSPVAPAERRRGGPALNRAELIGRLAGDPQLRYTTSGIPVCTLRIATNDRDTAEFHDVVVWRQQAEFAGRYLAKGRLVFVQGRLHGRTWQMQDGTTRRSVEVLAEDLQALTLPPATTEQAAAQPDEG